jgi:hypothetical protein
MGGLSYPLYIIHYPFIYLFAHWNWSTHPDSMRLELVATALYRGGRFGLRLDAMVGPDSAGMAEPAGRRTDHARQIRIVAAGSPCHGTGSRVSGLYTVPWSTG